MIGGSQPEKSSQGFVILRWDVNWGQMPAAIEPSKHDGIEAISFTAITRSSRNQ
jgi:hypothetical protein